MKNPSMLTAVEPPDRGAYVARMSHRSRMAVAGAAALICSLAFAAPVSAQEGNGEVPATRVEVDQPDVVIMRNGNHRELTAEESAELAEAERQAPRASRLVARSTDGRTAGLFEGLDPGFWVAYQQPVPPDIEAATNAALLQFEAELNPSTAIVVSFEWFDFGDANSLGAAFSTGYWTLPILGTEASVPSPIASHQLGFDVDVDEAEAVVRMNAGLYGANGGWCVDTVNSCRPGEPDFYNTLRHELTHAFGFASSASANNNGRVRFDNPPFLFDTMLRADVTGAATPTVSNTVNIFETSNPNAWATSGRLWLDIDGGEVWQLFAPGQYIPGSSVSHLDEDRYSSTPIAMMTPFSANDGANADGIGGSIAVLRAAGWDRFQDGRPNAPVFCGTIPSNPTLNSAGGPFSSRVAADGNSASIWRLYSATFRRQPDQGGFDFWHSRLHPAFGGSTANYAAAAAFFVDSPEFIQTYGQTRPRGFVSLMYRNVFARCPDRGGYEFWVNELESGRVSRADLLLRWSDVDEFLDRTGVRGRFYE